ncbi:MAG TPA: glycosyltransferase family 4 protein [Gemmataceae bacterium]|nr:glycosyltransferase family 4 protein [Gemmataceae bacterium]
MLILHTAHTYAPELNGVAEVVRHISTRLAARGHELHVATSRPAGMPATETIEGVAVHRFDVEGEAVHGIHGNVQGYVEFVRSRPWDVLGMHYAPIWSTDVLLPHLAQIRAARVFIGHGLSIYRHPKYQPYLEKLGRGLLNTEAVVSLSPRLEESTLCRRLALLPPHIIPNGVDRSSWQAPLLGLRARWSIGNRPWLLSVANHSPVKEHGLFFELLKAVRRQQPDAVGTIIGNSYPAAKWRLGRLGVKGGCWYRCRARSFLWSERVLRPNLPREEVISAIGETDVVVITSRREASPVVMLESMAAGKPWVSFDVGCVRENAGGVVVGSLHEMTDVVLELLRDPERRRSLGAQGRARIAERHDWDVIAQQYESVYHEACKARSQSAAVLHAGASTVQMVQG